MTAQTDTSTVVFEELYLQEERQRNEFVPRAGEERPTRFVCMGGGTGLPTVLRGLSRRAEPKPGDPGLDVTAIVAMSDDGGSSGRLRRSRGILPPGDIRNCLVAMAPQHGSLREVFNYRFGGTKGLAGHAVGNLLIAALTELKGDFLEAVRVSSKLLSVRGTVLPSTLAPVQLVAQMENGVTVVGERAICKARNRVKRIALSPQAPAPADGILEAIHQADLITIGPGSLYSSILPNLLVDGVAEALRSTRALKVLVSNLMTQPGETDGMTALDHVRAIRDHVGAVIDVILLNATRPSRSALDVYAQKDAYPVSNDRRSLIEFGVIPVEADLLKEGSRIRHDSGKVARCLVKLARSGL